MFLQEPFLRSIGSCHRSDSLPASSFVPGSTRPEPSERWQKRQGASKGLGYLRPGKETWDLGLLQRIASALIEAPKRLDAPLRSLFWRPMAWAATLVNGDYNYLPSSDPCGHCAIRKLYRGDKFEEMVASHRKTGMLTHPYISIDDRQALPPSPQASIYLGDFERRGD